MKFKAGDQVIIKHQRNLGVCEVLDPCEPTNATFFRGKDLVPVGFYVRIKNGKKKGLGYHEDSLEIAADE